MKQLIACCGLDCENCDARIATVTNDDALREKTAKAWGQFAFCSEYCEIRKCVHAKGFNTCGDCKELDNCPIVGAVFQHAPGAKENLLTSD